MFPCHAYHYSASMVIRLFVEAIDERASGGVLIAGSVEFLAKSKVFSLKRSILEFVL